MEKLFSYGTLQQENVQMSTFGRILEGKPDAILGYRKEILEIKDPSVIEKSGKKYHPVVFASNDPTEKIAGMVLLVSREELAQADEYEVSDYKRVSAKLASGVEAWVYISSSQ